MTAARAIAWEFHRRHRVASVALGAYLGVFALMKWLILGPGAMIRLDPPNGLAGFIIAPVSITYFYLVAVFSYGLSGDLAARESIFPRRILALPVSTRALAGLPMLYGVFACATLWLLTAALVRMMGVDVYVPWVWPACLAAAYLAWTQALMWMPYGFPGVRVAVAALWLAVVDALVLVSLNYRASEWTMVAICAPQIPIAYLVARYGVARARRGETPDWERGTRRSADGPKAAAGRRSPRVFASASRAQTWFEWKRHGRILPAMVALVVPVELVLLFVPGNDTAPVVFLTLGVVLITPPFLALFAAAGVSTSTTYLMTRPMTSASLVAAKIRASLASTLVAWVVLLALVPAALAVSGTLPVFVERVIAFDGAVGHARTIAVAAFGFAVLFAATWKRLVQSLCIGLTGRDWVVKSAVLLALVFLVAIGPLLDWLRADIRIQSVIWHALPLVIAAVVLMKAIAAAWVAARLARSGVIADRALMTGAAGWLATVLALYGALVWFADAPSIPRYFLASIAIVSVPLARVSAAPLALAWSRHR